jgi:hypothetical protein
MIKTISHIETFQVNGGKPGVNSTPLIVRAPKFMKCFRSTITARVSIGEPTGEVYIATAPTNLIEQCIQLTGSFLTDTNLAPGTDTTIIGINTLILDRRGVGYMEDELYFYSNICSVAILWEGIKAN